MISVVIQDQQLQLGLGVKCIAVSETAERVDFYGLLRLSESSGTVYKLHYSEDAQREKALSAVLY